MDPGRHEAPPFCPDQPDAKVQVGVVDAKDDHVRAGVAGLKDRAFAFPGLPTEGPDERIAQAQKRAGRAGQSQAFDRRFLRREGQGDGIAMKEVFGLVE